MIDIINDFSEYCANRVLITGTLLPRNQPLDPSVKVIKISKYNRKNHITRIISWVVAFFQILYSIKFKYRSAHVFFVSNPPLVQFIPLFIKSEFSFLIYDIYPDTLFNYKLLNPESFAGKFWKRINRKVFRRATHLFTISESMRDVIYNYSNRSDICVVPLWSDASYFKEVPDHLNPFLIEQDLVGKFIVLYSGNLGLTHNVEIIVDIARETNHDDIFFLIIGSGEKTDMLKDAIEKYELKNCRLLPFQPVDKLPFTLGGAKVGIVTSGSEFSNLSIPSKAFTLIAAEKPLLCITNPESELSKIVSRYEIGKSFSTSQISGMVDFIINLYENKGLMDNYLHSLRNAKSFFGRNNSKQFVQKFSK